MARNQQQLSPSPLVRVPYSDLLRYYLPLALQSASQSLTYPLVASVASHGVGGPLNLAGVAQANGIMFLMATLGSGLVITGMVYVKSRESYARFWQVNLLFASIVVLLQTIMCLPPLAHLWFHRVMHLPTSIEHPAYAALVASVVMQALFFFRNPYQVCLYTHGATGLASSATLVRIVSTVMLIPVFLRLGLVGPVWAVVLQTFPIAGEVLFSRYFARQYIRALPRRSEPPPTLRQLITFTIPLSIGALFLSIAGVVLPAIMALSTAPEHMLQAFYLASGLAGPAAVAAARIQPVVLTFRSRMANDRPLLLFALLMGVVMGVFPLLFFLPGLGHYYFLTIQRCPRDIFPLVRISAIGLVFYPLTMAFRAFYEGKAALLNKPKSILLGQIVFLCVLSGVAFLCLKLMIAGNLLAPISLFFADIVAALAVCFSIAERQPGRGQMSANKI